MHNNEVTVVFLCCRVYLQTSTISDLKTFICQHSIQWRQVYELCTKHRIRPIVFHVLNRIPDDIPSGTLQLLRQYCRDLFLFAADRQIEAARIVRLLHEQGIDARLYKGTDFSLLLYNDISMREFTDMDIIIGEDQVMAVKATMEAQGYEMDQADYFSRYPAHFKRHLKDLTFGKRCPRGRRFSFEFHYRPTRPLMGVQYSFQELLGNDYQSRSYTYQDYYSLMLLNNGASDFYPHLRSLIDMVLLYRKGPVPLSKTLQPFAVLWQRLAATLLGVDTGVLLNVHDPTYQLLLKRLQHPQFPGKYTFLQQAHVNIVFEKPLAAKVKTIRQHMAYLMRPNGNDFEALKIPYFLYYVTKPVRLAANMLKREK